jgi:CheY-like chemotaxis protein
MFNVLLVEDNSGTQILLKNILRRKFYCNVFTAKDGMEAIKLLPISNPDFIIVDYMMPNMNGYEFLKELKLKKVLEETPVIMITAVNEKFALKKVLDLGIKDYILKPFNIENTLEKIAKIMGERNKNMNDRLKGLERRLNLLEKQNTNLKNQNKPSLVDRRIFLN